MPVLGLIFLRHATTRFNALLIAILQERNQSYATFTLIGEISLVNLLSKPAETCSSTSRSQRYEEFVTNHL